MSRAAGQKRITDRQRIIGWYKENVQRYKQMIGEETEYGTVVTVSLIKNLERRIEELEKKEGLNDIRGGLSRTS